MDGETGQTGMGLVQKEAHAKGGLAQLGEHLLCKQGVVGSIPSSSTNNASGNIKARKDDCFDIGICQQREA